MLFSKESSVFTTMIDGKLVLSVSVDSGDDTFRDASIANCSDGSDDQITLELTFSATDVLDTFIEMNSCSPQEEGPLISVRAKPVAEQLKAELLSMVKRIEALEYA